MPVWACFKNLQHSEFRIWHRPLVVYGVKLRILGTKNAAGETLFLAYRGRGAKRGGPVQLEMAGRKSPQCVENTRLQSGRHRIDPR